MQLSRVILPAVVASSQQELDTRLNKVFAAAQTFHLDVMDGKFVNNASLLFDFQLPSDKSRQYESHLMVGDPATWIESNAAKVDAVNFHVESACSEDIKTIVRLIREKGKKAGIVLNPDTPLSAIEDHIPSLDRVMFMAVHPGKYGAEFVPAVIGKIRSLREKHPSLDIVVDGAVSPQTIVLMKAAGANLFVCGSYIQQHEDPQKAVRQLELLVSTSKTK